MRPLSFWAWVWFGGLVFGALVGHAIVHTSRAWAVNPITGEVGRVVDVRPSADFAAYHELAVPVSANDGEGEGDSSSDGGEGEGEGEGSPTFSDYVSVGPNVFRCDFYPSGANCQFAYDRPGTARLLGYDRTRHEIDY